MSTPAYKQVEVIIPWGPGTDRTEEQAQEMVETVKRLAAAMQLVEPYVEDYAETD